MLLPATSAPQSPTDAAVRELLATRQPWASDWPFVQAGVVLTYLGPHFLLLSGDALTEESFAAYLAQIDRVLGVAPIDSRRACLFHFGPCSWWDRLSLREKSARAKQWAALVEKHRTRLEQGTSVCVNVPANTVARALLRTILILQQPFVPTTVSATAEEGWTAVKRHFPELDVPLYLAAHEALAREHAPSLLPFIHRRRRLG